MGSIMGSQNIIGLDYGSNISVVKSDLSEKAFDAHKSILTTHKPNSTVKIYGMHPSSPQFF
jgi:hypothetical protein